MKDHRFIELVNLYIDRQISAAETAELEAEIQGDPRRRALYRQYCQMHRATTLVYESFRAQAPVQTGVAAASGQAVTASFRASGSQRSFRWAYYASGLAAAACLSLIFVRVNSTGIAQVARPASVQPSQVASSDQAVKTMVAASSFRSSEASKEGLLSLRNSAVGQQEYTATPASLRPAEERIVINGEVPASRVASLFQDGVFDNAAQAVPAGNLRAYGNHQASAPATEFTAFQFQR